MTASLSFEEAHQRAVDATDEEFKDSCQKAYDRVLEAPTQENGWLAIVASIATLAALVSATGERIERRMKVHAEEDPHLYPDGSRL